MPGRWEGAYIAHILTYNAIMYAIRQNIAGGVGVAARRYNYSTQPQENSLLTEEGDQVCKPVLWIRNGSGSCFFYLNADHCETLPSQKAEYLYEKYIICHKTCCFYST
jgi:hypothetical protein